MWKKTGSWTPGEGSKIQTQVKLVLSPKQVGVEIGEKTQIGWLLGPKAPAC